MLKILYGDKAVGDLWGQEAAAKPKVGKQKSCPDGRKG